MIETHAHIYDEAFEPDFHETIARAKAVGVTEIWMPNCDTSTIDAMLNCTTKYPGYCLPMLGLHPCYVKENFEDELSKIEVLIETVKPIAIGEIGLDLHWDKTFYEQQKLAFLYQCKLALKYNIWIDIHSREAFYQTVELIEQVDNKQLNGIFHCFSGDYNKAKKAIDLGFLLGIGGVLTFKNAGLVQTLEKVDLKHIVIETDAPYLAPTPYRGKRNEPSYLQEIVGKLAEIYAKTPQEIMVQTTQNALKLKQDNSMQ